MLFIKRENEKQKNYLLRIRWRTCVGYTDSRISFIKNDVTKYKVLSQEDEEKRLITELISIN